MFAWILGFSILGSVGAILGAAVFLAFPEAIRRSAIPNLLSYASGTLLAAAFLGMLPAGLARLPAVDVFAATLAGIGLFFVLEKLVIWRQCADADCEVHGTAGALILIGDGLHNFVDGIIIAGAFVTSVELGVATSLAVIAHEVPQEVGEFAILLDAGYDRRTALLLNTLSSTTTIAGAVLAYLWLSSTSEVLPYVLAVSAASFIYIAMTHLIPGLHRQVTLAASLRQIALLAAGVATIAWLHLGR